MTIEEKAKAYDEARKKIAIRFGSYVADEIFSQFELSEDERIRKEFCKDIWTFIPNEKAHKYIAWLEKRGDTKETLCDKCRKEQPSHSCQDITELGRCYLEHEKQGEKKLANSAKTCKDEQKPAWSEEDEKMLKKSIRLFNEFGGDRELGAYTLQEMDCRNCADWLKSLRPQNRWKPSDEQIDMLAKVCSTLHLTSGENEIMESLYEQLKKLK